MSKYKQPDLTQGQKATAKTDNDKWDKGKAGHLDEQTKTKNTTSHEKGSDKK